MGFQGDTRPIAGTFDGLTYYYNKVHGWLVRTKGGPTGKQVRTHPNFIRSRENSQEFTTCSKTASQMRRQVILQTGRQDTTLYARLFKLAKALLNEDKQSARGKRDPRKVMNSRKGLELLKTFKINSKLNLYQVLVQQNYIYIVTDTPKKTKKKWEDRPVNRTGPIKKLQILKADPKTRPVKKEPAARKKEKQL